MVLLYNPEWRGLMVALKQNTPIAYTPSAHFVALLNSIALLFYDLLKASI